MRLTEDSLTVELPRQAQKMLSRVRDWYACLCFSKSSSNFLIQKSPEGFRTWRQDESGLVLAFTALCLPVILLIGVLVLQSGQLYVRQAQLQFLARQAANSALIPVAEILQAEAEENYKDTCDVEFPPGVCSSDDWTDFLTPAQAQSLAAQSSTINLVDDEANNFSVTQDPQALLDPRGVTTDFPVSPSPSDQLIVEVVITEPQTNWIGNILSPDDFNITATARSYLNLTSS